MCGPMGACDRMDDHNSQNMICEECGEVIEYGEPYSYSDTGYVCEKCVEKLGKGEKKND